MKEFLKKNICIFNPMRKFYSIYFIYSLYLIIDGQICYSWPILLREIADDCTFDCAPRMEYLVGMYDTGFL